MRDLAYLLGQVGGTRKDFWDGKDWQKDDFDGPLVIKGWKEEKEFKEFKEKEKEKEKDKDKEKEKEKEKPEKPEKPESKENKIEKLEVGGVFEAGTLRSPDPRLDQVIQALSGLTARVAQRRPGRGAEEGSRRLIQTGREPATALRTPQGARRPARQPRAPPVRRYAQAAVRCRGR